MYIEKRKVGKNVKYYLVHSYRKKNKVEKIRKYLGQNLTRGELENAKEGAKQQLALLLEDLNTGVFLFSLTNKQLERLNKYEIDMAHFDKKEWQMFTEEFVYNTNAIEGSAVQSEEVPEILQKSHSDNADEIETKGVAKAV